jgi:superfamily II DNA or RNA helicase
MEGSFITNQNNRFLSEIINGILPKCDESCFLVGYFYFSGFAELYQQLQHKKLRVLVGLDIERDMINRIREVDYHSTMNLTRAEVKQNYFASLVDLFNETDYFDSRAQEEAFKVFYEKIKDGSLQIRKTKEPNHAKMYLFENREEFSECGSYPGALITGSSNLSLSGLKGRWELNAILRGNSDFKEGKRIFEELWNDAITIADKNNIAEFENGVIEKTWFEKLYSPYSFYLRVLYEYFAVNYDKEFRTAHDITNGKFLDLKYQANAIQMSLATIENHNGVIISDVVGLGKSVIGSAVAHNLALRTIIIAPPHLVKQWEDYRTEFDFNAKVFSSGSIDKALKDYQENSDTKKKWLIILDEAHKYRNEFTQDYFNLHQLCQGNKVMLLTATPFNNRPQDIYSMIRLFQIPSKSTLKTVDNLGREFRELIKQYKELTKEQKDGKLTDIQIKNEVDAIAGKIRSIISPLVIRRSRLDLKAISSYKNDLKKQKIDFAEMSDPELLEYPLGKLKDLYIETLNLISPSDKSEADAENAESYKAARYQPISYVKKEREDHIKTKIEEAGFEYNLFKGTQRNLSKFMRHLLVRRFESSTAAFRSSLEFMISSSKGIVKWAEKRGKVPIYKKGYLPDIDLLYQTNNDDIDYESKEVGAELELEKLSAKGLFEIDLKDLKDTFLDDVKEDIALLEGIHKRWFENKKEVHDPKLDSFEELLRNMLTKDPNRKIVVFSEFADTINYLYGKLKDKGLGIFKYTSADASPSNKEIIRTNFDAGLRQELQCNDYQILIATDSISEGYNLHRAGTIFNYDIPYNPTRVIQRIGRINRINKKMFDKLHIFNYFPTDIGEKETRTKEISTLKMAMIHAIMGEDTKVLTGDEELRSYFKERYDKEYKASESLSWETPYRELLDKSSDSEYYRDALNMPHRAKIGRKTDKPQTGVLVFGKKSNDYVFKIGINADDAVPLTPQEAISLFEATVFEQPEQVSAKYDAIYQNVKLKLFETTKDDKVEKAKREALDKIKAWIPLGIINKDYLNDLREVIDMDGLSGHSIRFINSLKEKDCATLLEQIEQSYINRMIKVAREVDLGSEVLILSEELK